MTSTWESSLGPVDVHVASSDMFDSELDLAFDFFNTPEIRERMGALIRQATDEVIATARTKRWSLDECNNQEKAYLGVNVENLIRAEYKLSAGRLGMDFDVNGTDVDAKWSRNFGGWQIPVEAVGHICLLIYGDDLTGEMAVGLLRIRESLLVGGNRDRKRTVQSPQGRGKIRWLVAPNSALPKNFLMNLRERDRNAILAANGGNARACELFRRCEGVVINRKIIEAVGQQSDGLRRFRGETRAQLQTEGFNVINGHRREDRELAMRLGGVTLKNGSEWVCLRTDGSSPARQNAKDEGRAEEVARFLKQFAAGIKQANRNERNRIAAAKAALV